MNRFDVASGRHHFPGQLFLPPQGHPWRRSKFRTSAPGLPLAQPIRERRLLRPCLVNWHHRDRVSMIGCEAASHLTTSPKSPAEPVHARFGWTLTQRHPKANRALSEVADAYLRAPAPFDLTMAGFANLRPEHELTGAEKNIRRRELSPRF
jgi:hypothetical protein